MYETNSAILLIVFDRPEQTKQIFDVLRAVRPKRLYVAADAPRQGRSNELTKCHETLSIFDLVDWPCEVFYKVNDENLGSHTAIPQAIDWFFDNEEMGIVLEDDCLPSQSFFRYCDELLEKYKNDKKIMWVNGSNLGFSDDEFGSDYCFSNYTISWGWASWRRAWFHFDEYSRGNLPNGVSNEILRQYLGRSFMAKMYWKVVFEYAYTVKNWDYRWLYVCWSHGGLACTPRVNMVRNMGFGIKAMHGGKSNDPRGNVPAKEITGTIKSPKENFSYVALDEYLLTALYDMRVITILKVYIASRLPWLRNTVRRFRNRPV